MRPILIFTFIVLTCSISQAQDSQAQQIDNLFKNWNSNDSPGASVAVVKGGETIYQNDFGLANIEHDIPISKHTVFNIGSVTKTITATCIMLLIDKQKMKLSESLFFYFPSLPIYTKDITVKHLLTHTSGLRDYLVIHSLTPNGLKYERDALNDNDILAIIKNQKGLDFIPGTDYSYSNSGYWLLGKIIQKVTGKSLAQYAHENIFSPLEMTATQLRDDKWVIIKNRASGYWVDNEGNWLFDGAHTQIVGPSGIYTSMNDLLKWHHAFYRQQFIKEKLVGQMTQKSILPNNQVVNSGSGVEFGSFQKSSTYGHAGASFGFKAVHWYYPKYDLGIIILSNRHDAFGMRRKANKIAAIVTNSENDIEPKQMLQEVKVNLQQQKQLEGLYWNQSDFLNREIRLENDTMQYVSSRNRKYNLKPIGEVKYSFLNDSQIMTFSTNEKNRKMSIQSNGQILKFDHYHKAVYSNEELKEYIGEYYAEELGSTIELFLEDKKIGWSIEGKKYNDYLEPLMKDKFLIGGNTVFEFKRNKLGAIIGFNYNNTRANGLYFRKS